MVKDRLVVFVESVDADIRRTRIIVFIERPDTGLAPILDILAILQQSKASLSLRQKSIELAQKTYDMTLTAYNHGTKDLLSLQTASDNLLQAKVNLMHEAYTLSSAILDLENTIGVPFGTLSK